METKFVLWKFILFTFILLNPFIKPNNLSEIILFLKKCE